MSHPGGPGKRRRGDGSYTGDGREDASRPSPHRPDTLQLGQRLQQVSQSSPQHGSRGGRGGPRNSRSDGLRQSPRSPGPHTVPTDVQTIASRPVQSTQIPAQTNIVTKSQKPDASVSVAKLSTSAQCVKPQRIDCLFKHVTDDVIKKWDTGGKKEIENLGIHARQSASISTLSVVFQELYESVAQEVLDASSAGLAVKSILAPDESSNDSFNGIDSDTAVSLFLDTLSIYAEISEPTSTITPFVLASGISIAKMRAELDVSLLEALGLIRSTFVRLGIRHQTNLLYRQSNYNLLREETEGYSKLVTELFDASSDDAPTTESVHATFEKVKGMIGAFDLDVGRVLDITLDVFAAVLVKQYRFFVKYFKCSSWWPQEKAEIINDYRNMLGPLPRWALPDSQDPMSENELTEACRIKDDRDVLFWKRCRENGMSAFFELGGRRPDAKVLEDALNDSTTVLDGGETRKWIQITKTLPPAGNKVAAQIMGFKLRFYNSQARDANDTLPLNLIFLAALLIKIGFISLRDLYPHIWPDDGAMQSVRDNLEKEKLEKEKLARPGGGTNALLAAAPLPDDTMDGPYVSHAARLRENDANKRQQYQQSLQGKAANVEATKAPKLPPTQEVIEQLPEPSEQKLQLLRSLLCIGALPEALYIIGRFPWLLEIFPDLPEYIHRILHHCLEKVYSPLRPLKNEISLTSHAKIASLDQSGMPRGHVRRSSPISRKTMRWARLDKDDSNDGIDYRFYWDDWADTIPNCQTVDDVFTLCGTLLNISGVRIGQDPALLLKLSRIGIFSLKKDSSHANLSRWIDLSKRLLVPALSLTKCNPSVVNEVFDLIKNFPEITRYNIYAEWNSGQISRLPYIKAAFDQTKAETRDVLKRISKTTIKPMARALAKVSYSSPGVVFAVAIGQLEAYENLVEAFVECARYFTYLAYDVLTWSLMNSLGAQGRNRLQADGLLTSRWLGALSLFVGKVFKRYSIMNPLPIVRYVENQLRQGNPTDLIVLESITASMAGIVSDINLNESQVIAVSAGDLLRNHVLQQLLDRRHESKLTAKRLMKPLVDSKIAGQLLVCLAQELRTCIYKFEDQQAPPKLLGHVFDQIHRVLGQYLDLLRSNLTIEAFDSLVPGCADLMIEYGLDAGTAFWISRQSLHAAMSTYDFDQERIQSADQADALQATVNEDTANTVEDDCMIENQGALTGPKLKSGSDFPIEDIPDSMEIEVHGEIPTKHEDALIISEKGTSTIEEVLISAPSDGPPMPCHPVLRPIAEKLVSHMPELPWAVLCPGFFTTFWQLMLADIFTTVAPYDEEIKKLNRRIIDISADRTDMTILGNQRKQREKESIESTRQSLHTEMRDRLALSSASRLRKQKDEWFVNAWGKFDILNVALIEHCFFPRLVQSPIDAFFTFRMIRWLHREGTANFRTMGIFDQFFREKRLTLMIFLCSAKEAEYLGRFIHDTLRELSAWHADKATYEKEAYGPKRSWPGFAKKMKTPKEVEAFWEFEDFRRVFLKWHRAINSALKTCYASGEYMHIRNAINVLNHIHKYFPAVNWMGSNQLNAIQELSKKETREDLKVAALSLMGCLKRREREWVLPQAFSLIDGLQPGVSSVRTGTVSIISKDSSSATALNPQAQEFKPTIPSERTTVLKGLPRPTDAEDGEIDDLQMGGLETTTNACETTSTTNHNVTDSSKQYLDPNLASTAHSDTHVNQSAEIQDSVQLTTSSESYTNSGGNSTTGRQTRSSIERLPDRPLLSSFKENRRPREDFVASQQHPLPSKLPASQSGDRNRNRADVSQDHDYNNRRTTGPQSQRFGLNEEHSSRGFSESQARDSRRRDDSSHREKEIVQAHGSSEIRPGDRAGSGRYDRVMRRASPASLGDDRKITLDSNRGSNQNNSSATPMSRPSAINSNERNHNATGRSSSSTQDPNFGRLQPHNSVGSSRQSENFGRLSHSNTPGGGTDSLFKRTGDRSDGRDASSKERPNAPVNGTVDPRAGITRYGSGMGDQTRNITPVQVDIPANRQQAMRTDQGGSKVPVSNSSFSSLASNSAALAAAGGSISIQGQGSRGPASRNSPTYPQSSSLPVRRDNHAPPDRIERGRVTDGNNYTASQAQGYSSASHATTTDGPGASIRGRGSLRNGGSTGQNPNQAIAHGSNDDSITNAPPTGRDQNRSRDDLFAGRSVGQQQAQQAQQSRMGGGSTRSSLNGTPSSSMQPNGDRHQSNSNSYRHDHNHNNDVDTPRRVQRQRSPPSSSLRGDNTSRLPRSSSDKDLASRASSSAGGSLRNRITNPGAESDSRGGNTNARDHYDDHSSRRHGSAQSHSQAQSQSDSHYHHASGHNHGHAHGSAYSHGQAQPQHHSGRQQRSGYDQHQQGGYSGHHQSNGSRR